MRELEVLVERLLQSEYSVSRVNLTSKQFEPSRVAKSLESRGMKIYELGNDVDLELQVEEFLLTSGGRYVYVLKFKNGQRFLARGFEGIKLRKVSEEKYKVKNIDGLKRLLLALLSKKKRIAYEVPISVIWALIGLGLWQLIKSNFLASLIMFVFSFVLNEVVEILRYFTFGYCRG